MSYGLYSTISCMTAEPAESMRIRVVIDGWHWVLALAMAIAFASLQFSILHLCLPLWPPSHTSSRTFECTIYVSLVSPLDILPASVNRLSCPPV